MSKGQKDNPQSNGAAKGIFRFRYMDSNRQFEVNADNVSGENLLEGFRHVANAIAGRTISSAPAKLLKPAAGAAAAEASNSSEHQHELEFEPESTLNSEQVEASASGSTGDIDDQASTTADENKPRPAPRAPKFLADLNLTTAKLPLAEFIKEKSPESDADKYAVIIVWYKQHFNTEEVSIDHIFTAYDHLGWKAQMPGPDAAQTLRNLKKKNWLVQGTKRGFFKVNWNGEDAVNKMSADKAVAKGA